MPPWLWTVIGVLVVIIWSSWSSSSSRTPAMPAVTDDGGLLHVRAGRDRQAILPAAGRGRYRAFRHGTRHA
jgi:hypothetical protein